MNRIIGVLCVGIITLTNFFHIMPFKLIDYMVINTVSLNNYVKSPVRIQRFFSPLHIYDYIKHECKYEITSYSFLNSIFHDYDSRAEGIINFLSSNSTDNQIIQSTVFDGYILFYTNLKIVNQLDSAMHPFGPFSALVYSDYPNAKKYAHLNSSEYDDIDFFIVSPRMDVPFPYLSYLEMNKSKFKKIYIDFPDIFDSPNFMTTPNNFTGLYIYKRISK